MLLHVLIISTDQVSARQLSEQLMTHRCRVDLASTARQALDYLRRHRSADYGYHLVISDEQLDVAAGLDIIYDAYRMDPRTVGCLVVTPSEEHTPKFIQQARERGCRHIVPAPVEFGRIKAIIDELASRINTTARMSAAAPATTTQRIRRSVTGRLTRSEMQSTTQRHTKKLGSDARFVRCQHCDRAFAVPHRNTNFETPCIHCGGMNQVMKEA